MGREMRAVFDSDVLIDYLQGYPKAAQELDRYSQLEISIISWMEVMAGTETPAEEDACREFLSRFTIHQPTLDIATEAVAIRKSSKLRLPDAIVWATARVNNCLLVTRNAKDFPRNEPGIRIPYQIG
jgi:predicted nucleic acid-binding protein